ncbi:sigma-70 family RNA polymerase sigma factor [Reichenbachiella sp. MALMAid0571]|uniref:RNA polymerase sigma factor n=1 Tax=Reichenbachiella sp. MALMAid0571 TaxID=3143939 RepID=UPI0032DF1F89
MDDLYIGKILAGNSDAFRYFVNKYKNLVYSITLSIVKDHLIAEEVTQDVFVNAFKALKNFNRNSKFSTWIYKIAYNEALKKLKKTKVEILTLDENLQDDLEDESILSSLHQKEQQFVINKALEMLTSDESLVLRLFYLEEENINEVINITGWSRSKVKVTLFRARKNMYKAFNNVLNNNQI